MKVPAYIVAGLVLPYVIYVAASFVTELQLVDANKEFQDHSIAAMKPGGNSPARGAPPATRE